MSCGRTQERILCLVYGWLGIRHAVSFIDRHKSNIVKGRNKQIMRHLPAIYLDLRMERRCSHPTVLALIIFTINDAINSETEVRPLDVKLYSEDGTYCK